MKKLFLAASLAITPIAASACENPVSLTNDQVRGFVAILQSSDAPEFEKVFAYEELACAERSIVRNLAFSQGIKSGAQSVQFALFADAIFKRQAIILESYDNGELTAEQSKAVNAYPALNFDTKHVDVGRSCLSLYHSTTCTPGRSVDVRIGGISISYDGAKAELVLDSDGILRGFYVPADSSVRIPVRSNVF